MTEGILVLSIWFVGVFITAAGYIWYCVRVEGYHHPVPVEDAFMIGLFWFFVLPGVVIGMGLKSIARKWERYLRNN